MSGWFSFSTLSAAAIEPLHFFTVSTARGSAYGARLALFWTVLVVSPLMLLYGLTRGFIGNGPEATLVGVVVIVGFFAHWGLCLAEAEFGPSADGAAA